MHLHCEAGWGAPIAQQGRDLASGCTVEQPKGVPSYACTGQHGK